MTSQTYIHENLFLKNDLAAELYHTVAKPLPLVDYHNHLNPLELSTNRKFKNIAEAWVLFDPYKHRAMRICGMSEEGITGNASDKEKFIHWAGTVPNTLGNPLFLWSALELKRIFGIDEILSENNAGEIWDFCNTQLEMEGFGAADILRKFGAEIVCTSDDLPDDLTVHQAACKNHPPEVYPSLRGDSAINAEQPGFMEWLGKLEIQAGQAVKNLENYKSVITTRLDNFLQAGCRLADHSVDSGFSFAIAPENTAAQIFQNRLNGIIPDQKEKNQFKNHMLFFLATEYAKRGWTLQLHIGAHRFTSSRLRRMAGPAGGYATIGKSCDIAGLCTFLDELEKNGNLPRMILYTLNPADNQALATLTGSFAEDGVPGKIQFGPAWWYNDHYEGISSHLTVLASYGLLSRFVGMTTDSRSVFSFSRHEYFRRILCSQIAEWVDMGNIPGDFNQLSTLVRDVSYHNSSKFIFGR